MIQLNPPTIRRILDLSVQILQIEPLLLTKPTQDSPVMARGTLATSLRRATSKIAAGDRVSHTAILALMEAALDLSMAEEACLSTDEQLKDHLGSELQLARRQMRGLAQNLWCMVREKGSKNNTLPGTSVALEEGIPDLPIEVIDDGGEAATKLLGELKGDLGLVIRWDALEMNANVPDSPLHVPASSGALALLGAGFTYNEILLTLDLDHQL